MAEYDDELAAQKEFYKEYLPSVNPELDVDQVFQDNTDGILNGNILEFKLVINNLSKVLFQVIKYLSSRRLKGKYVPRNILLISLNKHLIYVYDAKRYLDQIEKIYYGGASKNDVGSDIDASHPKKLNLTNNYDEEKLIQYLRQKHYVRVHIDEDDIVGWAKTYYRINPNGSKQSFIGDKTGKVQIAGEIREPNVLKKYILPYKKKDNAKFGYLMDKLNDRMKRKNLGAFYTPKPYAEKSLELVREAIKRVPKGHDYIILDRCAGTGNLEENLTDEELKHTVLNTYEYYEYKVLFERLASKVRYIIPPVEKKDTFNDGLVRGSNALSKSFLHDKFLQKIIHNKKINIIMYENPPYTEVSSIEHQKRRSRSALWRKDYLVGIMKKDIKKDKDIKYTATNDMGNIFIWSAFKYYLRKPNDAYILFSPIKYWKAQHLIKKHFEDGFAFNRKWFHTNINATIVVAYYTTQDDPNQNNVSVKGYDLKDSNKKDVDYLYAKPIYDGVKSLHKIFTTYSQKYYDKRSFTDAKLNGIVTNLNGTERPKNENTRVKPIYSKNMLGYMVVDSSGFDNPDLHSSLLIAGRYNANGFFLHRDNYMEKLPMFAASRFIKYYRKWDGRALIFKSGDGSKQYFHDVKDGKLNTWLHKVLIFTIFEPQNHMRSLEGSDGRTYINELTLDITRRQTIAYKDLKGFKLDSIEKKLFKLFDNILTSAKKTKNYNSKWNYGLYQIDRELNTRYKDPDTDKTIYNYPELNGYLKSVKKIVKKYYLKEILPELFKYKFLI